MYLDSEGRTIFTGTKPEDFGPFVIMTVRDALNFTVDPVEEFGALLEDCRIVGKTLMYSVSTGHYRGTPVSIISTGTGGPSRELAMADLINNETQAHTVIDIGSCGTYQDFQDWGDANIDLLMRVPHHPDLDPSGDRGSGVRGNEYRLGPGGVAANVAAVIAQLGNRVGFIGVVGDDDLGRTLRQNLMARGIDVRYLQAISGRPTSLLCCFESSDGQAVFYSCPGPRRIPADCLAEGYLASAPLPTRVVLITARCTEVS